MAGEKFFCFAGESGLVGVSLGVGGVWIVGVLAGAGFGVLEVWVLLGGVGFFVLVVVLLGFLGCGDVDLYSVVLG